MVEKTQDKETKTTTEQAEALETAGPTTILPHLASRLFGTPLGLSQNKLNVVMSVMLPRLTGEMKFDAAQPAVRSQAFGELTISRGGIAIIPIRGSLVKRAGPMDAMSGLVSYSMIEQQLALALGEPEVKGILFDIDSEGGEVNGMFDAADLIFNARGQKPIWAIGNEFALSAAYMIASSAERVFIPVTGAVGSIGVLAIHVDQSAKDEKEGLKYTMVFAGERKTEFNPHEPLSDDARVTLQARVDQVHEMFLEAAARRRNRTVEHMRSTQAGMFYGQDAVTQGLADGVGSFSSILASFEQSLGVTDDGTAESVSMASGNLIHIDEIRSRIREEEQQKVDEKTAAYVKEVSQLCALAEKPAMAAGLIAKHLPVDKVREALFDAKASEADATLVTSSHAGNPPKAQPKIDHAAIYAALNGKTTEGGLN